MRKKSTETKNALADALQSILLENDRGAITVKSVSTRAGVDRQTFYYHFTGMEDLVGYLSKRELSVLTAGLEETGSLDKLMEQIVDQVSERELIFKALLNRFGRSTLKRLLHGRATEILSAHAERELTALGSPVDPPRRDGAVEYCALASASVLEAWLEGELPMNEKHLKRFLVESFRQQLAGVHAMGR